VRLQLARFPKLKSFINLLFITRTETSFVGARPTAPNKFHLQVLQTIQQMQLYFHANLSHLKETLLEREN
jgi:hypothetical protein